MDISGLIAQGRAETSLLEKVLTWEMIGADFSCTGLFQGYERFTPHLSHDL